MSGLFKQAANQRFEGDKNYAVATIGAALTGIVINAMLFPWLVKCDGVTDDQPAITAALAQASSKGGGTVLIGTGTALIGNTLQLPDYVNIKGAGQKSTFIKLKNAANKNLITKSATGTGIGAGLFDLTIDGNDANNAAGGVYWAGPDAVRGPTLTMERVTVTHCRPIDAPPSGEYASVLFTGSGWGVLRDVDIDQNQYAVGLWHKGSDWIFESLYLGPNGALKPCQSMIIQGGAGNRFTDGYFGGNGGYEQVMLWGTQRNIFVNCVNDNAWQDGYTFQDLAGVPAANNVFIGGQISSSGGKANNTYSNILLGGSAFGNLFVGVQLLGLQANLAKYCIHETDAATGNFLVGCSTNNNYGTNFDGRRAGSNSLISNVFGQDSSEVQILTAKKRINVTGPYDADAPSIATVPLLRLNNGGAVSIWLGAQGYANGWIQAIEDDGSNNLKQLILNPIGGGVAIGPGGLSIQGTEGNSLKVDTPAPNAAIATTLGNVGPVGATAGNPQGWMRINIAGVDRFMPYW